MSLVYIVESLSAHDAAKWEPVRGQSLALSREDALKALRSYQESRSADGRVYRLFRYHRVPEAGGGYVRGGV